MSDAQTDAIITMVGVMEQALEKLGGALIWFGRGAVAVGGIVTALLSVILWVLLAYGAEIRRSYDVQIAGMNAAIITQRADLDASRHALTKAVAQLEFRTEQLGRMEARLDQIARALGHPP